MSTVRVYAASRTFGSGRRACHALTECTFEAAAGEIVGVVGPNGAGKTTLLRLLAGDLALTRGDAFIGGFRAGTRAARRLVGYAPDPPVTPLELTGIEWLTYLASHRAAGPAARLTMVRSAVEIGGLEDFAGGRIAEYSRGMAQRLALAAAAMIGCRVLLLDEVLSGVDPLIGRQLRANIATIATQGRLVLIASHDLATLERLATRVLVLWRGRIVADVTTASLLTERIAELSLNGSGLPRVAWLLDRFPGAVRTGEGVAIPLTGGLTMEAVLAACHTERIAVSASRVRYRALEDVLLAAIREQEKP